MGKKSKRQHEADYANATLWDVKLAFSRAGLYLTSSLLEEVIRVAQYETATEIERYKNSRKRVKK
jgi:hypothetical protein